MSARALLAAAALGFGAALVLSGCGHHSSSSVHFGRASVLIATHQGPVFVHADVADTPAARARGLQGRASVPPDAGMVFLFFRPSHRSFYMKDMLVPLSIAFFDERGRILAIRDMPPCRKDPCPTYNPGVAYRGALEVNRGFFDRHDVRVGDRITVAP